MAKEIQFFTNENKTEKGYPITKAESVYTKTGKKVDDEIVRIDSELDSKADINHSHTPQTNCDTVNNFRFVCLTQEEYDALTIKDSSTLYFIVEKTDGSSGGGQAYTTMKLAVTGTSDNVLSVQTNNYDPGTISYIKIDDVLQTQDKNGNTIDYNGVLNDAEFELSVGEHTLELQGEFAIPYTTCKVSDVILQNGLTSGYMMFYGVNIEVAPTLPNTMNNCASMFESCENLIVAPKIPTACKDAEKMFYYCSSMTTIPDENVQLLQNKPADMTTNRCYAMCEALTTPYTLQHIMDNHSAWTNF